MNKQELINFETDIANMFNNAKIKAPIHLYYGNEEKLIKIFKKIKKKRLGILFMEISLSMLIKRCTKEGGKKSYSLW